MYLHTSVYRNKKFDLRGTKKVLVANEPKKNYNKNPDLQTLSLNRVHCSFSVCFNESCKTLLQQGGKSTQNIQDTFFKPFRLQIVRVFLDTNYCMVHLLA